MTSLQYTTAAGSDVNAEVAVGNAIYDMKAKIGSNNRPGAITDYNNGNDDDEDGDIDDYNDVTRGEDVARRR